MYNKTKTVITEILDGIREAGLWKNERIITTEQSGKIDTTETTGVLNFCANNYLGLANNKEIIEAAKASYDKFGYGLSSVRFICGTQTIHKELEGKLSSFLGTEDTILYSSCFDANGGGAVVNASRSLLCAHQKRPEMGWLEAVRAEAVRMRADITAKY